MLRGSFLALYIIMDILSMEILEDRERFRLCRDKFIGAWCNFKKGCGFMKQKLSFSAWEEGEKKKYESAAPSDPDSRKPVTTDIDESPASIGDDDIDFESL